MGNKETWKIGLSPVLEANEDEEKFGFAPLTLPKNLLSSTKSKKLNLKSVQDRPKTPPLLTNPKPLFTAKVPKDSSTSLENLSGSGSDIDLQGLQKRQSFLRSSLSSSTSSLTKKPKESKWNFFLKLFKKKDTLRKDGTASTDIATETEKFVSDDVKNLKLEDTDYKHNSNESENDLAEVDIVEHCRIKRRKDYVGYATGLRPLNDEFAKKYTLCDLLGDGAFGFVVVANRIIDDAEVAVKFIMKDQLLDSQWIVDDNLGKVPLEVYYLYRLKHPNIISFLDYYEDDDYAYLVTELFGTEWHISNSKLNMRKNIGLRKLGHAKCSGNNLLTFVPKNARNPDFYGTNVPVSIKHKTRNSCDLFECIDAHSFFPERIVRFIFQQIVSVIGYLHSLDLVHRDLKEENILVDENYKIKLIDFGAINTIPTSESEYFTGLGGTPDYSAPEILLGKPYRGPEAEVWSLGILLFALVFRQSPFQTTKQIVKVDIQYPFILNDRPLGVLDLIHKLLQFDENMRLKIIDIWKHPWMAEKDDSIYADRELKPNARIFNED
ncbi:kinase-like protein [Rozella allomycis CSF55]|uniref:Kinase-like protein n=1 Tax=Rozella allomycis (strain CSF55) TaxID=988480 RepID=A0A075ATQ3_ROZAC|nr:Protein kinase, catalytic domain-containing protein [Rozella allomycis CSF55]RKP17658.1 kinase-like protein [Rozella allomycis CSF55]|eukprot:EPZ33618.1 Protein kinase, catalytic domain-containing protein [Rozella allomycis CSF55]